ncbi:DUF4373 domain-containing protein [Chryseobacterium sp. MHB01]|uniref:DUF4373 domain-containing protein n=1 Tax=Chryseobacterium sp. MHB01 TaxID=3109433 RepID=UPI002AFDCD89|nr:DUF4373 domain-containing protein [Chryseobacterium sp. MHB01]MEA1849233.1 DUF4373 domain-containing protein [Chryseobacterium sp. MHB01]
MGRQIKSGLEYFPFDTKFFNNIKVRKLIKYQGGRSIVIYACLLCNIYEKGYYMLWDDEIPFLVSEKTGFEEGYIKEVIKCCFSVGLFDKNLYEKFKVVTSKGIQKRYDTICKISKRKNQIEEFSLINSEEMPISSEEISINSEETQINPEESAQSKVKKSKVNKIKEVKEKFAPPTLDEVLSYFDEKGYTAEVAKKAYDYYHVGKWIDSKGNPVKNWKQKMISVWMKPEHLKVKPLTTELNPKRKRL